MSISFWTRLQKRSNLPKISDSLKSNCFTWFQHPPETFQRTPKHFSARPNVSAHPQTFQRLQVIPLLHLVPAYPQNDVSVHSPTMVSSQICSPRVHLRLGHQLLFRHAVLVLVPHTRESQYHASSPSTSSDHDFRTSWQSSCLQYHASQSGTTPIAR
eukprot:1729822-Rhodomonas_salina.2